MVGFFLEAAKENLGKGMAVVGRGPSVEVVIVVEMGAKCADGCPFSPNVRGEEAKDLVRHVSRKKMWSLSTDGVDRGSHGVVGLRLETSMDEVIDDLQEGEGTRKR